MIAGQYNANNDDLTFMEIQKIVYDKDNIVKEVVVNGKKFTNEDIFKFKQQGFYWFYMGIQTEIPQRGELMYLIEEWKKDYEKIKK